MIDTRFSTALQVMASVAVNQEHGIHTTSQSLAQSVNANPSFIRKLLGPLSDAGLIQVTTGGRGGIVLGRIPSDIRVSDVYRAVVPDKKIWETRGDVPCVCVVSRNIESLSERLRDDAERSMLSSLDEVTLASAVDKLKSLDEQVSEPAA
jgi:Rrf2 family transcriptional repressor of oqxAB